MPRFRKKPVEISAVKWTGSNPNEVALFMGFDAVIEGDAVKLTTVHGDTAWARPGDWIIPDPPGSGQFYPCAPDVFAVTYDPVEG